MANTQDETMLNMMKIDLAMSGSTTVYDERLGQYIQTAKAQITREGYTFPADLSVDDMQVIVMYATWMWLRRDGEAGRYGSGSSMPRSLRRMLNDKLFAQKAGGSDD